MKSKKTIYVFTGMVVNEKGEILMTKRSEKILPEADNHWELPGGKVDFGETPEKAVEREIFEETGYKAEVQYLLPVTEMSMWEYQEFTQHTIVLCFKCILNETTRYEASDHKVSEVKWFKPDEVLKLLALPGTETFINSYFRAS